MANTTITNLPTVGSLSGSEPLLGVQAGSSVQITTGQIASLAIGQGGSPFAVSIGGTGRSSFTQNGVVIGNGTSPLDVTVEGATGQILVGNTGGPPSWSSTIPSSAGVVSLSFGTTGLLPSGATSGAVTVTGTLNITNGGTGATSAAGARTNLGLGTMATQDANAVAITGGTINGTSIGATTSSTGKFTTVQAGAGAALGGATNPLIFANGSANSYIQNYIRNTSSGTSASSDWAAYADNGTDASGWVDLGIASSAFADALFTVTGQNESYLFASAPSGAGKTGNLVYATDSTGSSNAHQWYVGGFNLPKNSWTMQLSSTGVTFGLSTGQRFLADFDNATVTNRFSFQTKTSNASTGIYALPNGSSTAASWQATNAADPTNASKILIATNGSTDVQLVSGRNGTGTYLPLSIYTGGSQVAQVGTTGNWGFGGNATTFIGLAVPLIITGATSAYGQRINGNVKSDVTTLAAAYFSNIALENAAFTTTDLIHFLANPPSGGAGSTATNQYGFRANSTLGSNGAATVTNSYGFYSDLASAANKWNFFANGTANNAFAGNVRIGSTTAPTVPLDVTGAAAISTSLTTPSVIGGTAAGSTLTLTSTTNASASGDQILIKVGNSGGVTAATFASTDAFLQLGAGTTAIAPLKFTSGTNLTTATAGSVEYNGVTALVTPIGAERGLAVTPQYYVNNATRTGPTAAASFVNITPLEPSLSANTRYAFEIYFAITKTSANACTGAIGFSVTGTAPAAISYQVVSTTGATQSTVATASCMSNYLTSGFGTAVPVTAASAASANTYHTVSIKGTIDTGAGAITSFAPQFQYSTGSPTASTFQVGSYMYIYPLSTTASATSVGTWA